MRPLEGVRRILLVKLRAIGDAVLTLPSVEALHRGFPGARITVVCPPASVAIYAPDPRIAEVLAYDKARLRGVAGQAAWWSGLQGRRFDLAVCLHASFRTALMGWGSGAERRSIRNHSGPDWFSTLKASEPKEPKSIIQRDFDALRACGLAPADERPRLFLPAAARAAAARRLKAWTLAGRPVLLFPGAGKPEKRWPLERFLGLARRLRRAGRAPVLLGGPGEPSLAQAAAAAGAGWDQVADLKELGALTALAGWAIGNDSGPRHIAAASGARTLTLFGPETLREWHPYQRRDGHWAVQPESGDLGSLGVDEVMAQASAWLKGKGRG
jgi:ADP-heptose:LPS heptosyltransferase